MKTLIAFASLFVILSVSLDASAEDGVNIALTAPADLVSKACPTPVWKDLSVIWNGVKDKRTSPEVGSQTQKGKEPIPVLSNPPLDQVFASALKNLLGACGMKFVSKDSEGALNLSAELKEFYAGVEKKLITGKSTAKSSIVFATSRGGTSSSVTVGYEMESKKIRSGNIKQLTSTLNDLFTATLKQIPATEEMKELK